MIRCVLVAFALLSVACTPKTGAPTQVSADCNRVVERRVSFTAPDAADVVEARAIGATCETAVVVWTLRTAKGAPLWAHAAPFSWLHEGASAPNAAQMQTFLDGWAGVAVDDTSASPPWPDAEAAAPAGWGPGGTSMFGRETYESIRAAKLPRLCVPTTRDTTQCLFYDADAEAVDVHFTAGA
jgi:hypothetical protein